MINSNLKRKVVQFWEFFFFLRRYHFVLTTLEEQKKKRKEISGEEKSSWEKKVLWCVFFVFFDGVKATRRLFALINESKHQTGCIPQVNPNF